jgi:hypothetical protein
MHRPNLAFIPKVDALMHFLREVNEEKAELRNQLAERENTAAADLELERSKRIALQRRVDADEADRNAAHHQVGRGKRHMNANSCVLLIGLMCFSLRFPLFFE